MHASSNSSRYSVYGALSLLYSTITRKMCSRIDLQTHAERALNNPVTLTLNLLNLGRLMSNHSGRAGSQAEAIVDR